MLTATFEVPVEGIGTFTFRKRTIRDQIFIEAEGARLLGADNDSRRLENMSFGLAAIRKLLITAPPGWSIDAPIGATSVEVPNIGTFAFRARGVEDFLWIEAEIRRITGGSHENDGLDRFARQFAGLVRLCVEAPESWDIEALDPLNPADLDQVAAVYTAVRETAGLVDTALVQRFIALAEALLQVEARFRGSSQPGRSGAGPGSAADLGVHLPPALQPAAD